MALFLVLSALSSALSFFSSTALVPVGVYVWGPSKTALLLFGVALQSESPSYMLGALRYPFPRYFPMMMIAELPFVLIVVYLGEAFLERNGGIFAVALALGVTRMVIAFRSLQREMTAP